MKTVYSRKPGPTRAVRVSCIRGSVIVAIRMYIRKIEKSDCQLRNACLFLCQSACNTSAQIARNFMKFAI